MELVSSQLSLCVCSISTLNLFCFFSFSYCALTWCLLSFVSLVCVCLVVLCFGSYVILLFAFVSSRCLFLSHAPPDLFFVFIFFISGPSQWSRETHHVWVLVLFKCCSEERRRWVCRRLKVKFIAINFFDIFSKFPSTGGGFSANYSGRRSLFPHVW